MPIEAFSGSHIENTIRGIVTVDGKLTQGVNVTCLQTEIPRITNENGIFEMRIPTSKLRGKIDFRFQFDGRIDEIIPTHVNVSDILDELTFDLKGMSTDHVVPETSTVAPDPVE